MPIYEYVCTKCEHGFEALVSSKEPSPACPQCAAGDVKKVLSVFSASTNGASSSPSMRAGASAMSPCGTCGDPRGAGACRIDN